MELMFVIACGILSIVYGVWAVQSVMASDAGNQRMQEIAEESPSAFMALVKGSTPATQSVVNTGSKNTAGFTTDTGTERNKAYYDNLRRTNKKLYLSPAIQNQMLADAARLGDKW